MLDLETLGVNANAPILQIGMAYFKMTTGEVGKVLELNLNLKEELAAGAVPDASTIEWWMQQEDRARLSVFSGNQRHSTREALMIANEFLVGASCVWSHASFDEPIFRNALRRHDINPLFHYRISKDIRTLTHLVERFPVDDLVSDLSHGDLIFHTALDDCLYQISYVSKIYMHIKNALERRTDA
jgi:hypothetical protein